MKWLIALFICAPAFAQSPTCTRVAQVGYQEIVLDTTSSTKGEGLRFYLEKDQIAQTYLEKYQKGATPSWLSASLGTLGTGLILTGLFTPKSDDSGLDDREYFLIGGVSILIANFLIAKTLDYRNEDYLVRAVKEYNKRNSPKVYLLPYGEKSAGNNSYGVGAGIIKDF